MCAPTVAVAFSRARFVREPPWRDGTGLGHDPPSQRRRNTHYGGYEISAFVAGVRDIPVAER